MEVWCGLKKQINYDCTHFCISSVHIMRHYYKTVMQNNAKSTFLSSQFVVFKTTAPLTFVHVLVNVASISLTQNLI